MDERTVVLYLHMLQETEENNNKHQSGPTLDSY
jgi:hypothetical protein